MEGAVLIVAPDGDPHARAVFDRLRASGTDAVAFDPGAFPDRISIGLGDRLEDIAIDGRRGLPAAVYVRDLSLNPAGALSGLDAAMRENWRRTMIALRERSDFVVSILHRWEAAGVRLYNPLTVFPRITKPYQLALLADAGLPVPATCWSNDPDTVRRFASGRRVIYKPVAGGAATRELTAADLDRLDDLRAAPVCFQELLPGHDVRVYIVDGRVVASIRITSSEIDFRGNEQALEPYTLDAAQRAACLRAAEVLGLRFTGMDLKADRDGALKILELNPSPMFLGFDQRSGSDVLGALCAALTDTRSSRYACESDPPSSRPPASSSTSASQTSPP